MLVSKIQSQNSINFYALKKRPHVKSSVQTNETYQDKPKKTNFSKFINKIVQFFAAIAALALIILKADAKENNLKTKPEDPSIFEDGEEKAKAITIGTIQEEDEAGEGAPIAGAPNETVFDEAEEEQTSETEETQTGGIEETQTEAKDSQIADMSREDWLEELFGNSSSREYGGDFSERVEHILSRRPNLYIGEDARKLEKLDPKILTKLNDTDFAGILHNAQAYGKYVSEAVDAVNGISPEMQNVIGKSNIYKLLMQGMISKKTISKAKALDVIFDPEILKHILKDSKVSINFQTWLILPERSVNQDEMLYIKSFAPAIKEEFKLPDDSVNEQLIMEQLGVKSSFSRNPLINAISGMF